jgi:hypothetical protein
MQLDFHKFLAKNYSNNTFTEDLYLTSVQAGTEIFSGYNGTLTTKAYSISVQ